MTLIEFNNLPKENAREELFKCCGCTTWADELMKYFPFETIDDLYINSDMIWFGCREADWLEAFSHHPKIGEKVTAKKHESTKNWAQSEQSGVKNAEENILSDLAEGNKLYENKFGFIYIVCATGKSAPEMLLLLKERLNNAREKELKNAAAEQNKITHLRIAKLLS